MADIVLVHGMAANRKSWFKVPKKLKADGHNVSNKTLPGHEGNFISFKDPVALIKAVLKDNTKFSDYVESVVKQFPSGTGKVILIGHSMGGQVITAVAAQYPERIEKLIYVTAFIPKNKQSINSVIGSLGFDLTQLLEQLEPYIKKYPDVFASQPFKLFDTPFLKPTDKLKKKDFKAIKRYYVTCSLDKIIPLPQQTVMLNEADIPDTNVKNIKTDHMPQKSALTELMGHFRTFIKSKS